MLLFFGEDPYGRVDRCVGTHGVSLIHTRFFHVFFVPLVPTRSSVETVDADGIPGRSIDVPLHWRSAMVAWLQITVPIAVIVRLWASTGPHRPRAPGRHGAAATPRPGEHLPAQSSAGVALLVERTTTTAEQDPHCRPLRSPALKP